MMNYIYNFAYAYACSVGFAILFNVPKSSLTKSGFGGAIGWLIYIFMNNISNSVVLSTFIASVAIALIGEFFAIVDRKPMTVYIIPGIIPLVPGYGLYYTMVSIVEKRFDLAASQGSEVLLIAIAIAGALTIVLSLNSYRKLYYNRKKRSSH